MSSILNIGIQSLLTFQSALTVTSQNMSNAVTPFYSRRQVNFIEALFNNGVNIGDVRRVYDQNASDYLANGISDFSKLDIYTQQLQDLETMLDNDKNSIGKYINDSLKALQEANIDPSSVQSRTVYLNQLMNLSGRFRDINEQIQQQRENINSSIETNLSTINEVTKKIAEINNQVQNAGGQDITSLLDEREKLVQDLAQYIDFSSTVDDTGQINLTIGNGSLLVFGSQSYNLSSTNNAENPANLDIQINIGSSNSLITDFINGGQLAGLLDFRNNGLESASRMLGRLSLAFMDTVNQQNKLGMDFYGNLGQNIFTDINDSQIANQRVIANLNNTGTGTMSVNIDDVGQLTTDDYSISFTSPNDYVMTRTAQDGTVTTVSSGNIASFPATISADGFTVSLPASGFATGDRFKILPTMNAANFSHVAITDPKLLALGWPVSAEANQQNGGSGKIEVTAMTDTTTTAFSTPGALNPPIRIEFLSATSYQLVNAGTNAVIEGPLTYDPTTGADVFPTPGAYDPGYRVHLSGVINANDSFNINYNVNGGSDNRNGTVLADHYTNGIMQDGTLNFYQAYNGLTSDISIKTNAAKISYSSAETIKNQAQMHYDQISAVSVQEEFVNMMSYQQCYQASAQIIQTAKTLFDTIIGIARSN